MSTQTQAGCTSLERAWAERPRFFPRQLVTPDDLTLGQDYLRHKIRRLNRFLFGWGVVCGARVVLPAKPTPWQVVVQRGYILGPFGDEIMLEHDLCFDLRTRCAGETDPCATPPEDPWCAEEPLEPRPPGPAYLAVRYKELPARPVRVQPAGCGCGDETPCEYTRWCDGYELCVLDACPGSHQKPPALSGLLAPDRIPDCPPCPDDPWVVLAVVTHDAQGQVQTIDNCACRRMLVSLAPYWWSCHDARLQVGETPAPVPDAGGKPAGRGKP